MFVVLEGPDASGKSTQAKRLAKIFEANGRETLITKEPGGEHPLCLAARQLILDPKYQASERVSLLLFLADRAQHIEKIVAPALAERKVVVSDRGTLSSLVYYLAAGLKDWDFDDISRETLAGVLGFAQQIQPDLCFIADADLGWCMKRMKGQDRIESRGESFQSKVHQYFGCFGHTHFQGPRFWTEQKWFPKHVARLPPVPKNTLETVTKFMETIVLNLLAREELN